METPDKPERLRKHEFIDDEAELSGDDVVSEDESDSDDEDRIDIAGLIDANAKELSSDEEEDVRRLYQKQIETEDRRRVLMLQEQLEENDIGIGQRRRRKFRWQTSDLMDNTLARHYNPDDDDESDGEDDDLDIPFGECAPRLRRPTAESILMKTSRVISAFDSDEEESSNRLPSICLNEDSNSHATLPHSSTSADTNLNRFLVRDKELVQALSTKEVMIGSREEKDRIIQRELKKVAQSKSIFDQLY